MDILSPRPVTSVNITPEDSCAAAPLDELSGDKAYGRSLPTPITASSSHGFRNDHDRRFAAEASTSPNVSYSPYMADSTGGSASDHEHELDSPSSLSSWNSWAGGRRGDLGDVDELELDGGAPGEPELETVSELDEESSSVCSSSDRAGLDSDEDFRNQRMGLLALNFDASFSPRRKNIRVGGQFNDVSNSHHVHHASNQHHYHHPSGQHVNPNLHTPPSFPHFSPRAGGHGLSHASRYSLRAPPNLAARRRKGRIAELAEERVAAASESTSPALSPKKIVQRTSVKDEEQDSNAEMVSVGGDTTANEDDVHLSQTETELERDEIDGARSPSTPTPHSSSHSWTDFEFIGPPAIPVRCVSPSETVPVIPSPLCVCLNAAEEQGVSAEEKATSSSTVPASEEENGAVCDDKKEAPDTDQHSSSSSEWNAPLTRSVPVVETSPSIPSSKTSRPAGPSELIRKNSRGRRSSTPGRGKPVIPLRPCFKKSTSSLSVSSKSKNSSSECESNGESPRGRVKVRFSEAPPTEVRTHSPVEYDRKACAISNRLSPLDVEELREMKMEMGLLEAKWAATAASKGKDNTEDEESEGENFYPRNPSQLLKLPLPTPSTGGRKRADSVSSSSPSQFCKNRFANQDSSSISPADHLRLEREKERERACRLAGIGTGIGFRYSGSNGTSLRQLHHGGSKTPGACNSMISRFGLSKPPPPLPGMPPSPTTRAFEVNYPRPSSALPPSTKTQNLDAFTLFEHEQQQQQQDHPRGRTMDKTTTRSLNDSTSTDGTVTESSLPSTSGGQSIPELTHTSPSPHSSPDRKLAASLSLPSLHQHAYTAYKRPSILPYSLPSPSIDKFSTTPSHSPPSFTADIGSYCNGGSGYDSPASEFYESGSEYDLIG
jgi:hypothetical protein